MNIAKSKSALNASSKKVIESKPENVIPISFAEYGQEKYISSGEDIPDSHTVINSVCKVLFKNKDSEKEEWVKGVAQISELTKEENSMKFILILYFEFPIVKNMTSYAIYALNEKTKVEIPKTKNEFVIMLQNVKLKKHLSFNLKCEEEEFVTLKLLNQSFMSKWIFNINRLFERKKGSFLENQGNGGEFVIEEIDLSELKQTKKKKPKLFINPSEFKISERNYIGDWTEVKFSEWSCADVQDFLHCIFHTKKETFFETKCNDKETVGEAFLREEINGESLSGSTIKDFKDFGIKKRMVRYRLHQELNALNQNDGKFSMSRYRVFKKFANQKGDNFTLNDLKRKYSFTFDLEILKYTILKIIFNLKGLGIEEMKEEFKAIIENSCIKYFQFNVKVLAVNRDDDANILQTLGKQVWKNQVKTFLHLGLLIKNLQLDFYSNEMVFVRATTSSDPLLCVDVDCLMIEKEDIEDWVTSLCKEILNWNMYAKYNVLGSKGFLGKNCQDMVESMLKFLNKSSRFPKSISNFFEKTKTSKTTGKIFYYTKEFKQAFKISSANLKHIDPSGYFLNEKKSSLTFDTHEQLDQFVDYCNKIKNSRILWIDYFGEYELLKAFDRAFHIASYDTKKKGDLEKMKKCESKNCPFNINTPLNTETEEEREELKTEKLDWVINRGENEEENIEEEQEEKRSNCCTM